MTATVQDLGRGLVQTALREAVLRLDPATALVSSYHFGWCDTEGRPVSGNGGKAIRPTLALLSAQATGAPIEVGVPGAVAVELVHNFSLLHDDLMDRDVDRRHRATVWAHWGDATAVLAGDALLSLAHEVLLDVPDVQAALDASRVLATSTRELIRGQVQDMAFEKRSDVQLAECIEMAAGKTGALLAASAAIGAVLAGGSRPLVQSLAVYGDELGLAFQLVDDLLGIWGDPGVTGKPVYSDLESRKKSLPVTWVISGGGIAGAELSRWLGETKDPTQDEAAEIANLIDRAGGRAWAAAEAQRRVERAEQVIADIGIPDQIHQELVQLARFVVSRQA